MHRCNLAEAASDKFGNATRRLTASNDEVYSCYRAAPGYVTNYSKAIFIQNSSTNKKKMDSMTAVETLDVIP